MELMRFSFCMAEANGRWRFSPLHDGKCFVFRTQIGFSHRYEPAFDCASEFNADRSGCVQCVGVFICMTVLSVCV